MSIQIIQCNSNESHNLVFVKRAPTTWDGFFTIVKQVTPERYRYKILISIPTIGTIKHLIGAVTKVQHPDGRITFSAYYYGINSGASFSSPKAAINWCLQQAVNALGAAWPIAEGSYQTGFGGRIEYFTLGLQ